MSSSQHEITLEKLTYGGEAMGRLSDGRAVFVPFGLPSETVRIQLTQEKQNFARGEIIDEAAHLLGVRTDVAQVLLRLRGKLGGVALQQDAGEAIDRPQRCAQIRRVVLAEAHIERAGAGQSHAIAGLAEIMGEGGDEAHPLPGLFQRHVARRPTAVMAAVL
mgnify:CR=1 FL=1